MIPLDTTSQARIRHLTCFAVVVVILLPGSFSCSAEAPQDVPQQAAAPEAVSPFSRLADPSGCVIEQITTADHDEYQVQGASGNGMMLSMTASLEGAAEDDSIYQAYEMDLVTGEQAQRTFTVCRWMDSSVSGRALESVVENITLMPSSKAA